jgi:Tfp pilus assembly ATPase PilU
MCTMEKSLSELYQAGQITAEDALSKANHPQEFRALMTPQQENRMLGRQREGGR